MSWRKSRTKGETKYSWKGPYLAAHHHLLRQSQWYIIQFHWIYQWEDSESTSNIRHPHKYKFHRETEYARRKVDIRLSLCWKRLQSVRIRNQPLDNRRMRAYAWSHIQSNTEKRRDEERILKIIGPVFSMVPKNAQCSFLYYNIII